MQTNSTTPDAAPIDLTPEDLAEFARAWDERALSLARVAAALQGNQPLAPRPCCVCGGPALHFVGGRRYCDTCAPLPPPPAAIRTHVTPMMLRDVWADERGPQRVAQLLRQLPSGERARLCVDYWNLLRQSGCHEVSLRDVGIQFELAMLRAA